MKIFKSLSTDPERNLALEQELLAREGEDFVLLYINRQSVIVGRNQCPEAEADTEYCRRHAIPVIHRISGGGTVYHDEGNVNYSFITARGATPLLDTKPHAPVIAALAGMGVTAIAGERGELRVGGRKISGTAAYVKGERQMFHGTLLFDTDPEQMRRALAGNPEARGRKVASVPSETANLKPLIPHIGSTADFMNALAESLARYYNTNPAEDIIF